MLQLVEAKTTVGLTEVNGLLSLLAGMMFPEHMPVLVNIGSVTLYVRRGFGDRAQKTERIVFTGSNGQQGWIDIPPFRELRDGRTVKSEDIIIQVCAYNKRDRLDKRDRNLHLMRSTSRVM